MENERIPFEIIEIGAVKLNSERQIIDQYQVLIQPRVYKKLHHRTREIIQMDMKLLEGEGIPFYRAVKEFLKWCGEDALFCSWGNSDLLELQRNMKYYGMKNLFPGNLTPKKKPWRIRRSPAAAVICAEKISAKRSGGLRRGRRIITAWRTVRYMAG